MVCGDVADDEAGKKGKHGLMFEKKVRVGSQKGAGIVWLWGGE